MEEVDIATIASDDAIKRLVDDIGKTKDILREARDRIANGFKDLREEREALVAENGVLDVDGSEILKINAGGEIISVTRDTLTQIKGTRLEALFCGRWERRLLRDGDGRIFLDVNPACFRAVVDYLNERKIKSPDSTSGKPHVGKEDDIVLQQLLLAFGLGHDRLVDSKKSDGNPKMKENKAESDAHSIAPQEKWKNVRFRKWET